QADHPQYREFAPADLPGVRTVLDGRAVLDPDRWPGVTVVRLGGGEATRARIGTDAGIIPRGSGSASGNDREAARGRFPGEGIQEPGNPSRSGGLNG
ncbi:MAG: hypothetical protein AB7V44_09095, partial [Pseudonocardia sp.]